MSSSSWQYAMILEPYDHCNESDPCNAFTSYYIYLVLEKKKKNPGGIAGLINLLLSLNILLRNVSEKKRKKRYKPSTTFLRKRGKSGINPQLHALLLWTFKAFAHMWFPFDIYNNPLKYIKVVDTGFPILEIKQLHGVRTTWPAS